MLRPLLVVLSLVLLAGPATAFEMNVDRGDARERLGFRSASELAVGETGLLPDVWLCQSDGQVKMYTGYAVLESAPQPVSNEITLKRRAGGKAEVVIAGDILKAQLAWYLWNASKRDCDTAKWDPGRFLTVVTIDGHALASDLLGAR